MQKDKAQRQKPNYKDLKQIIHKSRQDLGIYCKQFQSEQMIKILFANYKFYEDQSQLKSEASKDEFSGKMENKRRTTSAANQKRKQRRKNKRQEKQRINQNDQEQSSDFIKKRYEQAQNSFRDNPKQQKIIEGKQCEVLDISFGQKSGKINKQDQNLSKQKQKSQSQKVQKKNFIGKMEVYLVNKSDQEQLYELKSIIKSEVNVKKNLCFRQWFEVHVPKFLRRSLRHLSINPQILNLSLDQATQIFKRDIQTTDTSQLLSKKQKIGLKLAQYDKIFKKKFILSPNDDQKKPIEILYKYYQMVKQFIKEYLKQLKHYLNELKTQMAKIAEQINLNDHSEPQSRKIQNIGQKFRQVKKKLKNNTQILETQQNFARFIQLSQMYKKVKAQFNSLYPPKNNSNETLVLNEKILED